MHRMVSVPLFPKPAAPRQQSSAQELSKPKDHVLYASLLAGVASALVLFAVFVLTLLVASLVWNSPYRSWFLLGVGLAYLIGTFTAARVLWRRLRVGRLLNETHLQVRRKRETGFARSNSPALHARRGQPITAHRLNAPSMALN